MPKGRPRRFVVQRPEQLRALASAAAHQIVAAMERLQPCTVTELAPHTELASESLYYHVRRLHEVGVLVVRDKRPTGGRAETVYELAGDEIIFDPEDRSPEFLAALARNTRSRLRYIERCYTNALGDPSHKRAGSGKNLSLHQHHFRLGPRKLAELYRRIEELEEFLFENDDPDRPFCAITIAIHPTERS